MKLQSIALVLAVLALCLFLAECARIAKVLP
jgi:hypothetical protein